VVTLLWMDAAIHQVAEQASQRWNPAEEHDEYTPREPGEPFAARQRRHVSQVVDKHNVPRKDAARAIGHVRLHLEDEDHPSVNPTKYGFASADHREERWSGQWLKKMQDPATWKDKPVTRIPTDEIHASQPFIRPRSVAHNLFWPGHKEPVSDEDTGDPDIHPGRDPGDEDDDHDDGLTDGERELLHGTAKFLDHGDGSYTCLDGHHRTGADMILGKKKTPGQVITENELNRPSHVHAIEEPWGAETHQHVVEHHGWDPENIADRRPQQLDEEHMRAHEWGDRRGDLDHYHPTD
jgi:hypothetical protein